MNKVIFESGREKEKKKIAIEVAKQCPECGEKGTCLPAYKKEKRKYYQVFKCSCGTEWGLEVDSETQKIMKK